MLSVRFRDNPITALCDTKRTQDPLSTTVNFHRRPPTFSLPSQQHATHSCHRLLRPGQPPYRNPVVNRSFLQNTPFADFDVRRLHVHIDWLLKISSSIDNMPRVFLSLSLPFLRKKKPKKKVSVFPMLAGGKTEVSCPPHFNEISKKQNIVFFN